MEWEYKSPVYWFTASDEVHVDRAAQIETQVYVLAKYYVVYVIKAKGYEGDYKSVSMCWKNLI